MRATGTVEAAGPAGPLGRMTEKPRVVLVHGAVERAAAFSAVIDRLADFDVVAFDRRGHGSRWDEGPGGLHGHVDDLIGVLDGRPATVVGHSIGGLVVLGAALRDPGLVRAVGLYETALPWAEWWTEDQRRAMLNEIERNTTKAARSDREPEVRERLAAAWASCHRDVLDAFAGPFRWQDLAVPVTVGYGSESEGASARDMREVAKSFGVEPLVLAGAGHTAHRSHPAEFAGFVVRCVRNSIDGPRGP
jgi:pimeloyl-ACP methyl ester carboxylesterase